MRRKRTRPWRSLVLGDATAVGRRLLLVEFVRHAVEGCLDGGGEEVGLVVEDVSEDLTGGEPGDMGAPTKPGLSASSRGNSRRSRTPLGYVPRSGDRGEKRCRSAR